jgi:hypothetical protein
MRVDQLPIENRYFNEDNDYRFLLSRYLDDIHAIVHFRRPIEKYQKLVQKLKKAVVTGLHLYISDCMEHKCNRFDHFAIVVDKNGKCYIGVAKLNSSDQYKRRFGFRLAVKRALESMDEATGFDFDIGIEPPMGRDLNDLVTIKLHQITNIKIKS